MKKLVLTLTAISLASLAAFAQGKIRFVNDSTHLVYLSSDTTQVSAGDQANAGKLPGAGGSVSGAWGQGSVNLVADLYGGTSSSSLTLQSTTTFSASSLGTINGVNVATTLPGGATEFFQIQIHEADIANASLASGTNGYYFGFSTIFTTTTGSSLAYNSLVQAGAPANSTFAPGAIDESASYGAAGAKGVIQVAINPVPEPASFALAGLGAAALMIFRRRNKA